MNVRRSLSSSVDPLPLSEVQGSTQPRDIDKIEWFGSPDDICRAFVGLQQLSHQPKLSPIASIFSVNKGGLGLDPSEWPTVWFKGGSEPGVLTLGYMATNVRVRRSWCRPCCRMPQLRWLLQRRLLSWTLLRAPSD